MKITDELVLEFERADFGVDDLTHLGQMTMINNILRKEMLKWVEFRGETDDGGYEVLKCPPHNYPTHRVRLMPPQKIQQKECAHEIIQLDWETRPIEDVFGDPPVMAYRTVTKSERIRCKKCGKTLRPKGGWEVV